MTPPGFFHYRHAVLYGQHRSTRPDREREYTIETVVDQRRRSGRHAQRGREVIRQAAISFDVSAQWDLNGDSMHQMLTRAHQSAHTPPYA